MGLLKGRVVEVNRKHTIAGVAPSDFVCVEDGQVEIRELVEDPKFSLYCFDPTNGEVIFVEVPNPAAVAAAPFYYQAQAEAAMATVRVPIETFHQAASQIPELPGEMILIHSVGRCGSTLVSKVFSSQSAVFSLSEPDDLTQLVQLHVGQGLDLQWIRSAIVSSLKWRCKPRAGGPFQHLALKTRSEVLVFADLIAQELQNAKHLFIYREAVDWTRSVYQAWPVDRDVYKVETSLQVQQSWARTIPKVGELLAAGVHLNAIETRLQAWITCTEGYLTLRDAGLQASALRFEDLKTDPHAVLARMFEFCEVKEVDWVAVEEVLGKDSQAGTIYDREQRRKNFRQLTDQMIEDVRQCVATHSWLGSTESILPGTFLHS